MLIGESNYSDAHLFPLAYKAKGIGKLVGMPVPGTGTFVWWENQIDPTIRFGIPMGCWRTLDGKCGENNQTGARHPVAQRTRRHGRRPRPADRSRGYARIEARRVIGDSSGCKRFSEVK